MSNVKKLMTYLEKVWLNKTTYRPSAYREITCVGGQDPVCSEFTDHGIPSVSSLLRPRGRKGMMLGGSSLFVYMTPWNLSLASFENQRTNVST